MKYRDLPSGAIFQFSPNPGERETAIKAHLTAYSLRTGNVVDVHANKTVDDVPRLAGEGYRLGTLPDKQLIIYSQANPGYVFAHDFLLIGHRQLKQSDVAPIVGKVELREQAELIDIILRKLEKNADAAGNLLKVLREGLFEDFTQIKLT